MIHTPAAAEGHDPSEVFRYLSLTCTLPGHEILPEYQSQVTETDVWCFDHVRLTLWEEGAMERARRKRDRRREKRKGPNPGFRRKSYPDYLTTQGFTMSEILVSPSFVPAVGIPVVLKKRGVDLKGRWKEVQKLFFAGFGRQAAREGLDLEELMQEVFLKISVANHGRNPFNPDKSSFGHYVHMICRSAFFNYRQKIFRRRGREGTGMVGYGANGEFGIHDVGSIELADIDHGYGLVELGCMVDSMAVELGVEPRIIQMAASGCRTSEIKNGIVGMDVGEIRKTMKQVRGHRQEFMGL